jgi:predicted Fe-Mo cluster-binding NifX family protein
MKRKLAIPLFGTRISPHFTYAEMALLVDIDNGSVAQTREIALGPGDELERIQYFKSLEIDTLICGGISSVAERMFSGQNVTVISWISGEARDALNQFVNKGLVSGTCLCAGRRRCRARQLKGSKTKAPHGT